MLFLHQKSVINDIVFVILWLITKKKKTKIMFDVIDDKTNWSGNWTISKIPILFSPEGFTSK